jgi:hypothetical protein
LGVGAVSVDVVVENQLLAGFDVSLGKNAHAQSLADDPFVNVAVWSARVVTEASKVSLFRGIDEFALRQGHEVEMFDTFLIILDRAPPERGLVDHLADILENEIIGGQVSVHPQAVALFLGLDH